MTEEKKYHRSNLKRNMSPAFAKAHGLSLRDKTTVLVNTHSPQKTREKNEKKK